ncbi:MAG: hypothetical protein ACLF0G_17725 [Candidatus Brocadiia bacterium]
MSLTLKHNGSPVDLAGARCELGSLVRSFVAPATLSLRRAIAFDEPTDWQNEDAVELEVDGTCLFAGRIKSSQRLASPHGEHILYTCAGLRDEADGVPFQRSVGGTTTARVVYNCPPEEALEEHGYVALGGTRATVGEMVADILDSSAAALAGILGDGSPGSAYLADELEALATVPGKVVLNGSSVDEALRAVLAHAPDFGFYADPQEHRLRFVDFRTLEPRDVAGVGGDVVRQELDFSTAGCYSACTVQGTYELVDVLETLTPAWDRDLEADWTSDKAAKYPDTYGTVWRLFEAAAPAAGGAVMPHRFVGSGDIIAIVTIDQVVQTQVAFATAEVAGESTVLLHTNARQWNFDDQAYEPASVVARYTYRTGRVAGRYPASGHTGTAHSRRGLCRELFLVAEERGKKSLHGTVDGLLSPVRFLCTYTLARDGELAGMTLVFNDDGVEHTIAGNERGLIELAEEPDTPIEAGDAFVITAQDDTRKEFEGGTLSILEKYAKETLERVMDERFVGRVPLAGLDWDIALGAKINFTATSDPEYDDLGATLIGVEHDLARQRTVLQLTSERALGGAVTFDELDQQRRRARAVDENAIQIRRLWRCIRQRRAEQGSSGDVHVLDDDGPVYTGDGTWITIEGKQVGHDGPGPVQRTEGGEGRFIEWIQLDGRGHVVDLAAGTFS